MKERNVEKEKTVKWKHLLITWLNEKGAKTLDFLQRFCENGIVEDSIEALHYCKIDVKIVKNV